MTKFPEPIFALTISDRDFNQVCYRSLNPNQLISRLLMGFKKIWPYPSTNKPKIMIDYALNDIVKISGSFEFDYVNDDENLTDLRSTIDRITQINIIKPEDNIDIQKLCK